MRVYFLMLLTLALAGSTGCKSVGDPASGSHASLRYAWPSLAEIERSITLVFGERGFQLEKRAGEQWVFDRPGTTAEAIKWGGLEGKGVVIRVKFKSRPTGHGEYLVECDVFVVQNKGENFFEDETRPMLVPRKEYQSMLVEAQRRLQAGSRPTP